VWYADQNDTAIIPFDASTHTFGKPIPNPTVIPYRSSIVVENVSPRVLNGAPLAPPSLSRGADGRLWGVGYADKRLGMSQYASTSAIVAYDPSGSSRAFSIPNFYTPGSLTVIGENGRPWSMVWTHESIAAVVQINANGSITPKFTVPRTTLPAQYSVRYAKFGANGVVWLLSTGFPYPRITRWILGSQSATQISLPVDGYLRCEEITTSPDGSAWIVGQEINAAERAQTYFYRVSPAGVVTVFEIRGLNSRRTCPVTIFAANGSIWAVATVAYGPNVGDAYLLRVDPSGTVTQSAIADARGAIAQVGPSIQGSSTNAFLSSSAGVIPELRYEPR
jgi:hypothetical protein